MNAMLKQLRQIIKESAQQHIMSRFTRVGFDLKADGSIVTEADTAMQQAVADELQRLWPEFSLLGEEMDSDTQQALMQSDQQGLWVLDPIDGTTNFASGVPIFSISLALIQQNQVVAGLIYDPVRDECFSAIKGQGAWLNDESLKPDVLQSELAQCIAQVDLKRLPGPLAMGLVADHPYASQRNFGSGALDWCWLAAGRSQLYLHGGQNLWDYAAGQLILAEAGGCSETFEGEPVFSNSLKKRSVIAASSPRLFEMWRDMVKHEKV